MSKSKRAHVYKLGHVFVLFAILLSALSISAQTQEAGGLEGQVVDPSGAVIPGAIVTLTHLGRMVTTRSGRDGSYIFRAVPSGVSSVGGNARGFALPSPVEVTILSGLSQKLDLALTVAADQQNVQVTDQATGVSLNSDANASALVLSGADLDALSDDPDQLQNELQALAGPAAGPNGGQIYIDGFTGGQLPPKSSIREIRINQNPFSAEFDRLGYGRVEILTKPGTSKLSGYVLYFGINSALDTGNPLVKIQPAYHSYSLPAYISGPLTKNGSYFLSLFHFLHQNQSIVDAINPANPSTSINESLPNPSSMWTVNPRFDFQLGKSNTLSIRDSFNRSTQMNDGVGALILPDQSYNVIRLENAFQASDTAILNAHLINETRFQWRRIRNSQTATLATPSVVVQGAFTDGGNNSGVVQDHQDIFELQNYSTATAKNHIIRFGTRLRAYRDSNYSTSGVSGAYTFQSISHYVTKTPDQYRGAIVSNALARVVLFDVSVFYQDDWHWKSNIMVSYGLRYEGQNRIHDHADWAPRLALAWTPGRSNNAPPKTVLRAGYGWFYNRFTVPDSFTAAEGTPYIVQTIHQNGLNEQLYVVNSPAFYDPAAAIPSDVLKQSSGSSPTIDTIDPHFHAALDMQAGVGVDRQLGKQITLNGTYLFTRGVHQYLSNNITAPAFNASTYTLQGPVPPAYNYQFQSGGVYSQHQLILTGNVRYRQLSFQGSYTLGEAKSDTQGVTYFPSAANNPGLDYGRAGFGIRHKVTVLGTYSGPYKIILSPMLIAQSGTPYNISIGSDLTGNNQFNARPTYGICGTANVVVTPYGCLDTNPVGKGEKLLPFGSGTGPANAVFNLRLSKAFGVGPKVRNAHGATVGQLGFSVPDNALGGESRRAKVDADVPRKYTLTLIANAYNLFNMVNRAPPNGVLSSPFFGTSQSLATGPFQSFSSGNRTILLQVSFNF